MYNVPPTLTHTSSAEQFRKGFKVTEDVGPNLWGKRVCHLLARYLTLAFSTGKIARDKRDVVRLGGDSNAIYLQE